MVSTAREAVMERDAARGTLGATPMRFRSAGPRQKRTISVASCTKGRPSTFARKQSIACGVLRAPEHPMGSHQVHFFFHIRRSGQIITDGEGSFHADLAAARTEARAAGREILANAIREDRDVSRDAILITDEIGRELATVSIVSILPDSPRQKPSGLE